MGPRPQSARTRADMLWALVAAAVAGEVGDVAPVDAAAARVLVDVAPVAAVAHVLVAVVVVGVAAAEEQDTCTQ